VSGIGQFPAQLAMHKTVPTHSLRMQINLVVVSVLVLATLGWIGLQVDFARRSIHEEIVAANRVAIQFLAQLAGTQPERNQAGVLPFLSALGRVRAQDIELVAADGSSKYRSPQSAYKQGRNAPAWFARLMDPAVPAASIDIGPDRLIVTANASRAVLDAWDDLSRLLGAALGILGLASALAFGLVSRALNPLREIAAGLARMRSGKFATRLPPFAMREAQHIAATFNDMAASLETHINTEVQSRQAMERVNVERAYLSALQERVDTERRDLAAELHDELGQSVTAIKAIATSLVRMPDAPAAVVDRATLISSTADSVFDSTHRIVARLRPLPLATGNIVDALHEMFAAVRAAHPQLQTLELDCATQQQQGIGASGESLVIAVYRVVQESISNALRHGHASRIRVMLRLIGDELQVDILDNGSGLAANSLDAPGRFGVRGMQARVQELGGSFSVASGTDPVYGGAHVQACIPWRGAGAA
jgi:two-component system, NarL family, sensor histidine kinase UhpB